MFAPLFCELIFITPSSIFCFLPLLSSIMSSIRIMKISISLPDELNDLSNDEDEAWQQAEIIDWAVSG